MYHYMMLSNPKKTVYLSGAINSMDSVIANAEFSIAEKEAKQLFPDYEIYNPFKVNMALPGEWTYEQIMNLNLAVLDECKVIYMMDGWQASRGSSFEHQVAKKNGLEVYYQKDLKRERSIPTPEKQKPTRELEL